MKIFLIGYMASGKSTLGVQLADALNLPFVDLDDEIEKSNGKTIAEIFEEEGAIRFRELEEEELEDIITHQQKFVMATGGGAPCNFYNMQRMNEAGITIYLNVPATELQKRIISSENKRPVVAKIEKKDLLQFIERKVTERNYFYQQAGHTVSGPSIDLSDLLKLPLNS